MTTKPALKLTEADVALACRQHAEAHGWMVLRITADKHAGQHQKRHEKVAAGTPDYVCVSKRFGFRRGTAATWCFFLETKKPNEPLRKSQVKWIEEAERDGLLVCVADSYESYLAWYEEHFA